MHDSTQILSIDQGTTSSRAIVFDGIGRIITVFQREFAQHYPASGWVEHDGEEIWDTTVAVARQALAAAGPVAAIGITNQRETTLIWDRTTGKLIHRAIVWQDRRTAAICERLREQPGASTVTEKTGLLLDPYFSGTKIAWILDNVAGARARAEQGDLAFGTVDTFLIWRLTGGTRHVTDATNACRTLLFNIHTQDWDDDLLARLSVPRAVLPQVLDNAADYGHTDESVLGQRLPIAGVAGDQHAATIGQGCFQPGMVKSTYGTGCFAMMNTGETPVMSTNRLLTTLAYRLNGQATYALEGSIFVAGAAVQWLRDGLKILANAPESETLAAALPDNDGVYLVPAFTGLGAPHWDPHARGAIFGITRDTGPAHLARAALESVCYLTRDLMEAMAKDRGGAIDTLRVDGGMVTNRWLLQFLADVLGVKVERPMVTETTALGAAYLAGLQIGLYPSLDAIAAQWQREATFTPTLPAVQRDKLVENWNDAVRRTLTNS